MIGFGTVGRSFAEILRERLDLLRLQHRFTVQVVAIVDRGGAMIDDKGIDLSGAASIRRLTGSVANHPTLGHKGDTALQVIESAEADVLLELTPTRFPDGQPAVTHIESAFKKGLHVITTNKGPLSAAMPALLELARYQGVQFRFSGTVAAGTQLLNYAKECFVGNRIQSITGILNGTTNYILTRMWEVGASMDESLEEARKLGYAEADPSYDVNGMDTASKLVILCNWVMGRSVSIRDVKMEGITQVSISDIRRAKQDGNAVKLVALANESEISVRPRPVSITDPMCVRGTLNAVVLTTELAGEITIIGPGAGGIETASAILSDLIDIKRTLTE